MSGNLVQTSPRRSAPVRTGGATPSAAEAAPVFGDLDPLPHSAAEETAGILESPGLVRAIAEGMGDIRRGDVVSSADLDELLARPAE